jgi:phage-related minor tail protein
MNIRHGDFRLSMVCVLLGGLAKVFGFGGARAEGGDVSAGKSYLIGERGPELMIPRSAGVIIPNHKLGSSGGNQTVNNHVSNVTVNANGGSEAQNQDLAEKVARQVKDGISQMMMNEVRRQMKPGGVLHG